MKADMSEKQFTLNVREFARQIWLAGLGAFAKTQEEGNRLFDTLVQEGEAVDARLKQNADAKVTQLKEGIGAVEGTVGALQGRAVETWSKLEQVFQTRVARALHRLGVPTRDDIQQLFAQIDMLSHNVQELARMTEAETKTRKPRATKPAETSVETHLSDSLV